MISKSQMAIICWTNLVLLRLQPETAISKYLNFFNIYILYKFNKLSLYYKTIIKFRIKCRLNIHIRVVGKFLKKFKSNTIININLVDARQFSIKNPYI